MNRKDLRKTLNLEYVVVRSTTIPDLLTEIEKLKKCIEELEDLTNNKDGENNHKFCRKCYTIHAEGLNYKNNPLKYCIECLKITDK